MSTYSEPLSNVCECPTRIEKEYISGYYDSINNLSYGEKYYLLKWLKQLTQKREIPFNSLFFKTVKNTCDIFNLDLDMDKYADKGALDFCHDQTKEFLKNYEQALYSVTLKKKPDLFLSKLKWINDIYDLEGTNDIIDLVAVYVLAPIGIFNTLLSSFGYDIKSTIFKFIFVKFNY